MSKKVLVISMSLRKGGADAVGAIAGHTALKKAYEMGKDINGKE